MSELTMYRGDTTIFVGIATNGVDGSPRDLTGDTMFFTAKDDIGDPDVDAVIQLSTLQPGVEGVDAIYTSDAASGVYYVEVPATATSGMVMDEPVTLVYDVQIIDADDRIFTIDRGTLVVTPDVTRDNAGL